MSNETNNRKRSLMVTCRETGKFSEFAGTGRQPKLLYELLESMQEGPDRVDVRRWEEVLGERGRHVGWTIEAFTRSNEHRHFDVRWTVTAPDEPADPARTLRTLMKESAYEPGAPPVDLTHFLMDTFLGVAEDVRLVPPPDAPFAVSPVIGVYGPWAPAAEFWEHHGVDQFPVVLERKWWFEFDENNAHNIKVMFHFIRQSLAAVSDLESLQLRYAESVLGQETEVSRAFREGLDELTSMGVSVEPRPTYSDEDDLRSEIDLEQSVVIYVTPIDEEEHDDDGYDDEEALSTAVNAPTDERRGEFSDRDGAVGGAANDEDSEEAGVPDDCWWAHVPLTRQQLDIAESSLLRGSDPGAALFEATGSTSFST